MSDHPFEDELAQMLGEPVEHAQRFFPGDRQLRPEPWYRVWRRWRGRGRVDDGLKSMTVAYLALTPTRVAVVESDFSYGQGHRLTEPFAVWRREQISATAQRKTLERVSSPRIFDILFKVNSVKAIRLSLTTPDGPLWADLPVPDRLSTDLVHALGARVSPE